MDDKGICFKHLDSPVSYGLSTFRLLNKVSLSVLRVSDEFSVPWHLIAVTLGVFCLLLLVTVTVLGTKILQCTQEEHRQEASPRNFSQKYHNIQNDAYLKEKLLNKTLEYDILKNETLQQKKELDSVFIEKKRCHRKQESFSKSLQNTGKLYEDRWSCRGVNCYYFTTEVKTWQGCKQTCQSYNLSLLKINDKDEQAFLQPQTYGNSYWIGLSYNAEERKWKWIDGDTSGINSPIKSLPYGKEECAFLSSTRIENTYCLKTYNCLCEKRFDCVSTACFK
ncbi:killer cell lectin-like receptor 5 [Diceros bicornis minor]|uniref:killer cell lectin-like receptor 5 n=1 Tax=Diceros bicornis minor TaxID=77932 RepID=UPI0026EEEA73|nr:killer cell lectin-like receptor 5 [Diceros bicornis minor]